MAAAAAFSGGARQWSDDPHNRLMADARQSQQLRGQHSQRPSQQPHRFRSENASAAATSAPGEIIEERDRRTGEVRCYEKGKFLGKGGFAKVYSFTELGTGTVFAAKVVTKASIVKPRHLAKLKAEISIHRSLRHPGIVGFERYFEDRENVYILLELCNHRSMMELMRRRKRLAEAEARFYTRQITDALLYMHRRRVIHRDLKLGNVFVSNMQCKLGDFGLAAKLAHDGERKRTVCGTPNYIAPEILAGGEAGHSYEVDTWSLGVLVFTLVVGTPPFETHDVKATYERIRTNQWGFPSQAECPLSNHVKDLVRQMLNPDPAKRIPLVDVLKHPWFTENATPTQLPESALTREIAPDVMRQLCGSMTARTSSVAAVSRGALALQDANSPRARGAVKKVLVTAEQPAARAAISRADDPSGSMNLLGSSVSGHQAGSQSNPFVQASQPAGRGTRPTQGQANLHKRRAEGATSVVEPRAGKKFQRTTNPADVEGAEWQSESARQRHYAYNERLREVVEYANAEPAGSPAQTFDAGSAEDFAAPAPSAVGRSVASPSRHADACIEDFRQNILVAIDGRLAQNADHHAHALVSEMLPMHGGQAVFRAGSGTSLATVWVYVWVDCSKRYGLGYQTTAGVFGAFFNDRSKMTLADDESMWYHQNIDGTSHSLPMVASDDPAEVQEELGNAQMQLVKKNTLIRYFRGYLKDHHKRGTEISQGNIESNDPAAQVFVMRWVRTKNAIAFRLSHGGIQVNFFDHTKLMLWAGQDNCMASRGVGALCYVDGNADRHVYSLSDPEIQHNSDLNHRLRYTAESIMPALTRRSSTSR